MGYFPSSEHPERRKHTVAQRLAGKRELERYLIDLGRKAIDCDAVERATGFPVGKCTDTVDLEPRTPAAVASSAATIRRGSIVGFGCDLGRSVAYIHPTPDHPRWDPEHPDSFIVDVPKIAVDPTHVKIRDHRHMYPVVTHLKRPELLREGAREAAQCLEYAALRWNVSLAEYRVARGLVAP